MGGREGGESRRRPSSDKWGPDPVLGDQGCLWLAAQPACQGLELTAAPQEAGGRRAACESPLARPAELQEAN